MRLIGALAALAAAMLALAAAAAGSAPPLGAPALAQAPKADSPPGQDLSERPADADRRSDDLDDPVAPFVPKSATTESQQDKLDAAAMFATAVSLESRENMSAALKYYQRAHRADPAALAPAQAAAEACLKLGRKSEELRYLAKAIALGGSAEPQRLWEAGDAFAARGEAAQAALMYDIARRLLGNNKNSAYVLLSVEAGRMFLASNQALAAVEPFTQVMEAVRNPEEYHLERRFREEFEGELGLRVFAMAAESFLAADKPDLAEAAFESLLAISPDKSRRPYLAARVAEARGDHLKAVALLEELFAQRVDAGMEPFEIYKRSLTALGRGNEFTPALEKLLATEGVTAALRAYMARHYREAKELDKARPLWEALATDETWRGAAIAALVETLVAERAVEPLLKRLGEAIGERQSLDGLGSQVAALANDKELLAALLASARGKVASDNNKDTGPFLAAALLAIDGKEFDAAHELFDAAFARTTKEREAVLLRWGLGLLMADQYGAAARVFQRGIDERAQPSDDPTLHYYLARALEYNKQTDAALAAAQQASVMAPDAPRIAGLAMWIFYHARRYDQAAAAYREFIDLHDRRFDDDAWRDELKVARLVLSNVYVVQKDLSQAEEWLEQVLDEFPDDPGALNDLAYLWADRNVKLQRSLRMLEQAVAAEPDNAAYRDSLGWALHRLGRHGEALVEIERSVAGGAPDGVVLDHLGDVLAALGRADDARDAWTRALAALSASADEAAAQLVRAKLAPPPAGK